MSVIGVGRVILAGAQLQLWTTWIRSPAPLVAECTVTDGGRSPQLLLRLRSQPAGEIGGQGGVGQGADGGDPAAAVVGGHHRREPAEVRVVVAERSPWRRR